MASLTGLSSILRLTSLLRLLAISILLSAGTALAQKRHYDVGRFSFNVVKGRCTHCKGEGFVMVELLFLPSVYTACPTCNGTRYNDKTLEVKYENKNIAEVLDMTVDEARIFF